MEAMDVDEANIKVVDTEQLVKQCFAEEEYAQLAASERIRYRIMCTRYLEDPDLAQKYTLKEFLNTKEPTPEKMFKEIAGSAKVYPPPKPYDGKFWHGCASSSSTSGQSALRKPTLEEMWDASDSEHAIEKGVQRERAAEEILEKRKRGRVIKKKDPPKKRGRKKKNLLIPKLKPAGKSTRRKKKHPPEPKTPATRSNTPPVTRSQARKLEAKISTDKKIEPKRATARKTETKKTTVKSTKRAAEKTEVAKEPEAEAVPENDVAKEVIQNSNGESTANAEAKYVPPAKKRRTPGRRFVPPPPPPCFYDVPPYKQKDSYIDSLTPPLPNPSFRNLEFCSSLQTCKCGPPPPKPRPFPTDIIDLTESSDRNVSANRSHSSLPQVASKLWSKIPLLPPPLAPLSSNAKPSTHVILSTNTDLGVPTVHQKSGSETTTVYYVPQAIQPADNSDPIISPGFYVPRTLEELPGQPRASPKISLGEGKPAVGFFVSAEKLQTSATLAQNNVAEQPPTSTLYVQQMQTQYRDIHKPPKNSKSHQSLPVTCSFVPTIQANTTTPYSITYVNSQPLTSSTFAVPDTPLTVSFTENVNMTDEMKAKIVKIARSSITSIPIIIPEREKRMQPKRIINRKKFIIAPKSRLLMSDQSNPPVSRHFQDLTKSLENTQNIGASQSEGAFFKVLSNMLPRQENRPEIPETIGITLSGTQGQEKRPAEMNLSETKSQGPNASAEIKPITAITTKANPQITIPPHVKPCPTHFPTSTIQTKPFITAIKENINPIVRPKLEPKTAASSEVFVSLSESQVLTFQEAQAEAFSTLTRPLRNIGPVPVQATYVQQQVRTYSGSSKRGRFISSGPSKIIAKTEVKTIEAPIIQVPIFQMPAGRAPLNKRLILKPPNIQIPLTLTGNQEGLVRQLPVIQPLVSLYPGVKSALNKPPEKFGKRPFQPDSSASASDDDEEVITIEFPPGVDQRQIQALSAQPIETESIQYVTTRKYTLQKEGKTKHIKIPKSQVIPPDQASLNTCPAKKGQTQYKAIAPKTEQTITSTLTKAPIITRKKIKTILPKPTQISSKSVGLNYSIINYTQSQIKTTASTLSISKPPYFTLTTRAQITLISTGSVQTLSTTHIKNIGSKIGQTRSILTSTDMIATTRPQKSTCSAKTVQIPSKSTTIIGNQPQIKIGLPITVIQTLCTSSQTTQTVKTIFTNTNMVQTTNMSSITSQLCKIPRIELIRGNTAFQRSDTTIQKPDSKIQKPDMTIEKSDTTIQKSDTTIQKSNTTIQKSNTTIQKSNTTIQKSNTTIQKSNTTIQKSNTTIHKSDTTIQKSDTTIQKLDTTIQKSDAKIQKSDTTIHGLGTEIQRSDTTIQRSEPGVQGHVRPTQIKQGPTVLPISTIDQSGTVNKSAVTDKKKKGSSPQRALLPRRRGRPSILATVMPFKKFAEAQNKVSKRPALHPVKVANFQRLISEVQKSVALSKNLKDKAEKADDTESTLITDQDVQTENEESVNIPQTSALAKTKTENLALAAIPPLKNVKILTPIRTCTGEILTNALLSEVRTLSTLSGATRISLVRPGIYQVIHTTSTGNSEVKLYTANEMLAAEILSNDLKRNLRKVIYKRVKPDENLFTAFVTITTQPSIEDATSTSVTSTASTSSLPDEETPEVEETPKIDEPDDTGN